MAFNRKEYMRNYMRKYMKGYRAGDIKQITLKARVEEEEEKIRILEERIEKLERETSRLTLAEIKSRYK